MYVALFLIAGCQQGASAPPEQPKAPASAHAAAAAPKIVKPTRGTVQRVIEQPGHVEAFQQTPMYAKIAGYVQKINVDIGDRVRKGDILAELWVPEREVEVQRKIALVQQAESEVEQAKKTFSAAEASVQSAAAKVKEAESTRVRAQAELARAKSTYDRFKKQALNVISEEQLEEARLGFEAARANVAEIEAKVKSAEALQIEAEAKRDKARADIDVANSHLLVTKAERDEAKVFFDYAKLSAPFDGVVTQRNVDERHFVQPPAGGGAKGEPLFVVMQTNPVRVFVDTSEGEGGFVRDGDAATIRIQALKGREFTGKVTRSTWAFDARAHTLRAEIDLENPDDTLHHGMYAFAKILLKRSDVWTLPASAVAMQAEQPFCFRVEGGRAVKTALQVGLAGGETVEVLKKKIGDTWQDIGGAEEILVNPAGVSDGQAVAQ